MARYFFLIPGSLLIRFTFESLTDSWAHCQCYHSVVFLSRKRERNCGPPCVLHFHAKLSLLMTPRRSINNGRVALLRRVQVTNRGRRNGQKRFALLKVCHLPIALIWWFIGRLNRWNYSIGHIVCRHPESLRSFEFIFNHIARLWWRDDDDPSVWDIKSWILFNVFLSGNDVGGCTPSACSFSQDSATFQLTTPLFK